MNLYVYLVCAVFLTVRTVAANEADVVERFQRYCTFRRISHPEPFSLCDPWRQTTLLTSNALQEKSKLEEFKKRHKLAQHGRIDT